MLRLRNISLVQFKNYKQASFSFEERITGICGVNGVGKTNLLDAIYYLCFTRGYFNRNDAFNVQLGTNGFRLEGKFELDKETHLLTCILRETGKKEFQVDGETYSRLSKHIGRFPAVMICPDDMQLITGGSEERRRWMDALFSQIDQQYLQHLLHYQKILVQRNSYLKSLGGIRQAGSLLDVYDQQLTEHGNYIYSIRKQFTSALLPRIQEIYTGIAGASESVELHYESQLQQESFEQLLTRYRERDLLLQRTHGGIHKDDLEYTLRKQAFKVIASQGQRKSLLFSIKVSEFDMLKQAKGFEPILLLDDLFEKLDEHRMQNLLQRVCIQNKGQVFITDTNCSRIADCLNKLSTACQVISI